MTASSLIQTKLLIPPVRPNLVVRPRLIERLNRGLFRSLTLISAPPGYGKTTLLAGWLSGLGQPAVWLTCDEGDGDPSQFLRYLIAAFQKTDQEIGKSIQDALSTPRTPPFESLVQQLINDLTTLGSQLVLVLDDYQLVTADAVHRIVGNLLESAPRSIHIIVSTREQPPLPLPRLRARDQVNELNDNDLRFTIDEAVEFFRDTMGLSLSQNDVQILEERTEGWITGLQLVALALRNKRDRKSTESFINSFSGDDRFIEDYLITEVLEQQPKAVINFLYQTSILNSFSAPLCQAVTGRKNSQALLEQLEVENLFLVALDNQREWYRYRQLFAGVLRNKLDDKILKKLHRKAARWYESHHQYPQAIGHAQKYAAISGDTGDIERLIGLAAEQAMHTGAVMTVQGWLDLLPEERVRRDATLATYKGWVMLLTNELALAREYAEAAEVCLRKQKEPGLEWGILLLLRAFIAIGLDEYEEVMRYVTGALENLGQDQPHWRVMALWAMAEAQERTCRITDAITTLRKASKIGTLLESQIFAILIEASLTSALFYHGQRNGALAVCEGAIERFAGSVDHPPAMTSVLFTWLGKLCYEANRLEEARAWLEKGLALSKRVPSTGPLAHALGVLAGVQHASGNDAGALETLKKAQRLAVGETLGDATWLTALEINIRLECAELSFAESWAKRSHLSIEDEPQYLRLEEQLAYARFLLYAGRLSDARRWLACLERFCLDHAFYRWVITVYILQARAAILSGNQTIARERLTRALEIAAPQKFYRAFLDDAMMVFSVIPSLRETAPTFVDQLLAYVGSAEEDLVVPQQTLTDPLSERELQVLGLIAAGLSNREIADELVIAPGTVKRHINHIYSKLDVHSRTRAIVRANELRLLR